MGYGDIYPRTLAGRIVIFFCSLYGVTVVSLMVVTITNTLEMSTAEEKAYLVMEKLEVKDQMKEVAGHMVTYMGKLTQVANMDKKTRLEVVSKMAKKTSEFKTLRR